MKLFRITALVTGLVIVSGCGQTTPTDTYSYSTNPPKDSGAGVACMQDAKMCPDGSYVSREGLDCHFAACPNEGKTTTPTTPLPNQPTNPTTMEYNPSKHYTATIKTTAGTMVVALNFGQTPNTVKNFVDLANKHFYDNTIFHRVIKGFMIQGGDPLGNGTGGPGYKFNDEPFTGEYTRGTIAMANAGPNTNGSQFFIMHADYPLPKNYTIFGHLTNGLEALDAIANAAVTRSPSGEESKPVNPVTVESVTITEE